MNIINIKDIAKPFISVVGNHWHYVRAIPEADLEAFIQVLLSEENRWYFPDYDELPHEYGRLLIAILRSGEVAVGKHQNDAFFDTCRNSYNEWRQVRCWRFFVPLPEHVDVNI